MDTKEQCHWSDDVKSMNGDLTFIGTVFRSRTTRPIPITVWTAATARSIFLLTNDFLKRKKNHDLIPIKKKNTNCALGII